MTLQPGKTYKMDASWFPASKYIGIRETPSGLMWDFMPLYSTAFVAQGKPFSLQYNTPGLSEVKEGRE